MGVVYRARQRTLQRIVAVKTVLLKAIGDPKAIERFEREARTLAQLQHPHIISAIDFGRHEGRVYLVMEHVNGRDLAQAGLALQEREIWQVIRQAAQGLAHAARHGIVHRDMKPANLMLVVEEAAGRSAERIVKIADFGLARLVGDALDQTQLTTEGMAVGTPRYMAPEQIEGGDVGPPADIYALGATAYELLAGSPPFAGLSLTQLLAHKLNQGPAPLAEIAPDRLPASAALVERMMSVDAAARPDYEALIHEIDALLGQDLDATATHPTAARFDATSPDRRSSAGRRLPIIILPSAAFAAAALLLALGFLWFKAGPPPAEQPVVRNATEQRPLQPLSAPQPLFYGKSLGSWQPLSGSWLAADNEPVIEGTGGAARHLLFRKSTVGAAEPLEHYRFEAWIELHAARAADIQFGIEADGDQRRYACRLTDGQAEIGLLLGEQGRFRPLAPRRARELQTHRPQAIVVERQPTGWFVNIADQQLAALPLSDGLELPEVRLSAESGPARFSDLTLCELAAAED